MEEKTSSTFGVRVPGGDRIVVAVRRILKNGSKVSLSFGEHHRQISEMLRGKDVRSSTLPEHNGLIFEPKTATSTDGCELQSGSGYGMPRAKIGNSLL